MTRHPAAVPALLCWLVLGWLLVPGWLEAAPRSCQATVASAFVACLERSTVALRACSFEPTPCVGARRAASRLRRKVLARCTESAVRDGRFPPPFDPAALAARLERVCLANAAIVTARGADVLPDIGTDACSAALRAAATRLVQRGFRVSKGCPPAGDGDGCEPTVIATRLRKVELKARRSATRRCRGILSNDVVAGVVARARGQTTCALAEVLPPGGTCAPSGAEALVDLWRLAALRPPGTRVAQVSSYDRTGGNADLGIGPDTAPLFAGLGISPVPLDFSYLYRDGDRYVVLDEVGPGVVWRIWMTGLDGLFMGRLGGDIDFELDGEEVPRLRLTREQLFGGDTPPFLAPLAGHSGASSGGFYSVVPIPFARRLRITTSTVPNWLQVTFSRLPPDHALASFDPSQDLSAVGALLGRAGDPATTLTPTAVDETSVSVAPGATQTVWSRSGSGTIVRLELLAPTGTEVPVGLRLHATFDGAAAPQVDAPLDDLFGASLGAGARSVAFGRDGDRLYCYFPMPFRSTARIELRNDGGAPFIGWTLRIGTVDELPPGRFGHLHASAASAHQEPDGRDYVLLETSGRGHVVGVVLTAGCGEVGRCQLSNLPGLDGAHLEGDERIAIDGSRWPQLHGTGLEDFFSGGFYFIGGPFVLPTHGNPAQVPSTSPRRPGLNLRSAYRVFLGDAIPFTQHIRLTIEHGPTNDVPADVSSLVFYYADDTAALVATDRLAIGDPSSEAAHALAVEDRSDVTLTSTFRGDDSDMPVTATGMTASVTRFQVAVDPSNEGVRLRRLADLAAGRQSARVTVDGAFAGIWQTSEVNPLLRWAEPEFELPAALTAGRATLDVALDARASPTPWTAFGYEVFSHLR